MARFVQRLKSTHKTPRVAWNAIHKRTGLKLAALDSIAHTNTHWRWRLKALPKKSAPKKATVKRRRNPIGSQRRAVKLYSDFHGENPRHIDEYEIDVPQNAVKVGMVTAIMYSARTDGKLVEYVHEFSGKSRPILAASADGKQLLFLDGDYDFTDRGIIDGTATYR